MIVMPANATGWLWHSMARETGRIGHLYSPGAERGPWPWFPYALDNGAFALWDQVANAFDEARWIEHGLPAWRRLLFWASSATQRPLWGIAPDTPGNWSATKIKWKNYASELIESGINVALAVQDGARVEEVRALHPVPDVICVGGSTDWKWETAEMWLQNFPRVHLLRCNSPQKLQWLQDRGCESCDGTGWNRGNRMQTQGIEEWARKNAKPTSIHLHPYACRGQRKSERRQLIFA